ncbi:hypothetical protein HYC85_026234 [Camellia sinensis]|uniref:Uncharacterized protein n=1 Tax=Camellia sinensis TaxID=4442 RepID=A0A7J7G488_CAMSI|nr:hypothetical protein HYC85_026234 [Camellia sinensis]
MLPFPFLQWTLTRTYHGLLITKAMRLLQLNYQHWMFSLKHAKRQNQTDFEVFLNCCRKKLQILLVAAGMDECLASHKSIHKMSVLKPLSASGTELNESPSMHWNQLVAEEVKAISQCASQMKTFIDLSGNSIKLKKAKDAALLIQPF